MIPEDCGYFEEIEVGNDKVNFKDSCCHYITTAIKIDTALYVYFLS